MTTALLVDHCAVGISGAWRQACRPYCPSISHGEYDRSLDNGVGGLGEYVNIGLPLLPGREICRALVVQYQSFSEVRKKVFAAESQTCQKVSMRR